MQHKAVKLGASHAGPRGLGILLALLEESASWFLDTCSSPQLNLQVNLAAALVLRVFGPECCPRVASRVLFLVY